MSDLRFSNARLLSAPDEDGMRFQVDVHEIELLGTFRIQVSGTYAGRAFLNDLSFLDAPSAGEILARLYQIALNGREARSLVILERNGEWSGKSDPAKELLQMLFSGGT